VATSLKKRKLILLFNKENKMTNLSEQWDQLKVLVESLEVDIRKSLNGNKSAGVRARKGLRLVKNSAADLIRTSLTASGDTSETE
jgi:hypothetical protein